MRSAGWNGNREGGALIFQAHGFDLTAMQMNKFLHQRQTNARAFLRARSHTTDAVEALEHMGQLVRRNTDAGVSHHKFHPVPDLPQRDLDLPLKGELEGV